MALFEAAQGSRLAALTELRDTVARAIDSCDSARDLAALCRQMTDVLAQIEAIDPPVPVRSPLDELASRRRDRSAS